MSSNTLSCTVNWPNAPLTACLVKGALRSLAFDIAYLASADAVERDGKVLQWSTYDLLDHEMTHARRQDVLSSSYTFRKALIRKHFLSRTINAYTTKYPDSALKTACPVTYDIEISCADELDAIFADELWELGVALQTEQAWWILKPGMADRGIGVRLFDSKQSLQRIFEDFEENDDSDFEDDNDGTGVVTSQLRHFVIQEYLSSPVLMDPEESPIHGGPRKDVSQLHGHKFHLRVYCVAAGALKVFVYDRILALFSSVPYSSPENPSADDDEHLAMDLRPHLTNTSLQTHRGEEGVRLLQELVGCHFYSLDTAGPQAGQVLTSQDVESIISQIASVLAETFKAALQNPIHFQSLPNAFELFGIDFLVTHTPMLSSPFRTNILEINSEPAIELTGPRLQWILEELFLAIGKTCVEPFFLGSESHWAVGETRHHLQKCLDESAGGPGRGTCV